MKLEYLLLGLLGESPGTGYEIKKFLDIHGRFLRSNTTMSQVYRSLSTMGERGWVGYTTDTRPGAQDAKIYQVTPEGMTVFLDWLTGDYSPPSRFQDPDLAVRLRFAGFMSREQILRLIDIELEARREQVALYRFRDRSRNIGADVPFDIELAEAIGERLHEWGAAQVDAYITALETLRRDLLDDLIAPTSRERASAESPVD